MPTPRMPRKKELIELIDLTKDSPEAAHYFAVQFEKKLSEAKLLEQSRGVLGKIQDCAKQAEFRSRSNTQPWSGEMGGSGFKNLHINLAEEARQELEEVIEGDMSLELFIDDQSQLFRVFTVDGEPCTKAQVNASDKSFSAWMVENDMKSKGGFVYEIEPDGEIKVDARNKPIKVTSEKLKALVDDKEKGFETYMEKKGIPLTIVHRKDAKPHLMDDKQEGLEVPVKEKTTQKMTK